MRRGLTRLAVLVAVLTLVGCSTATTTSDQPVEVPPTAQNPASQDLGLPYPDHVAFDEVEAGLFRGAEHCGWEGTWYVQVDSQAIDDHVSGDHNDLLSKAKNGIYVAYVRDPEETPEFPFEASPIHDTTLPSNGKLIGSSQQGYELWVDPNDPHHLYVASGETVEAWALSTEPFGCE